MGFTANLIICIGFLSHKHTFLVIVGVLKLSGTPAIGCPNSIYYRKALARLERVPHKGANSVYPRQSPVNLPIAYEFGQLNYTIKRFTIIDVGRLQLRRASAKCRLR